MTEIKKKKLRAILLRIAHATGIYFIFFILNILCGENLRSKAFLRHVPEFWSLPLYCKVGFVFSLIMLFSLFSIFTLNDYSYKKRFFDRADTKMSFKDKCGFIITDRAFLIELTTVLFWVLILPLRVFWFDLMHGFYNSYLMLLVITPIVAVLIFAAHMATVNWWMRQKASKGYSFTQKSCLRTLIKQFAGTAIIYPISAFALSLVFPMLMTFWNIAKYLGIAIVVAIVLPIALITAFKKARFILSRKKLVKTLQKLSDQKKCSILEIKNLYSSKQGFNLLVRKNNVFYCCKLVCAPKYKTPLYFHDDGCLRYTKGYTFLGIDLFYHEITTEYFFEGEGKKILIVVPSTIQAISTDGHQERKLNIGDRLMEYTIHDAESFLGAIDRDCL